MLDRSQMLGAAGALIIHETKPAAYPYDVVLTGGTNEGFAIKQDGADPNNPANAIHTSAIVEPRRLDIISEKSGSVSRLFINQ